MYTETKLQEMERKELLEQCRMDRFSSWLQENGYQEAAFLEKYQDEELVLQYEIGREETRIYLADGSGREAELLRGFPTERIGESRDLIGEVTLQASWIAWAAMDRLYGTEHNRLRHLPESADCGLAEHIRREYEGLCWQGTVDGILT